MFIFKRKNDFYNLKVEGSFYGHGEIKLFTLKEAKEYKKQIESNGYYVELLKVKK